MTLSDFLATSTQVGDCQPLVAGVQKLYLVPLGDYFSTLYKPEVLTELPSMDALPVEMLIAFQTCQFKSQEKKSAAGIFYQNTVSFNMVSDVADWLHENQEKKYWLIMLIGNRWIITGDEHQPYSIVQDYEAGRSAGENQGWDITLRADQLRPYFVFEAPEEGGGEGEGDPPPEV